MAVGVEEMDVRENMHPKNFIFKSDIDLTFVFLLIMWFYFILKYTNGTFKCNEHWFDKWLSYAGLYDHLDKSLVFP